MAEKIGAKSGALWLIAAAMFLAPIMGGSLTLEPLPLPPGPGSILAAVFGGSELPLLSHFILSSLCGVALVWMLIGRTVKQFPAPRLLIPIALLAFAVVFSLFVSSYRSVSLAVVCEWLSYCVALLAVIMGVGRESGPKLVLGCWVAGCTLVAAYGLVEYAQNSDPSWRIFSTWIGPNALAGLFVMGFFPALGLTLLGDRLNRLLFGLCACLIGFGLILTQSKGGYLAFGVGCVSLVGCATVWMGRNAVKVLLALTASIAVMGLFVVGLKYKTAGTSQSSALGRISGAAATQGQSEEFRRNLWKGAAQLIKENPVGYGMGTYRFHSAKPGLTTQTQTTHNSYLQLGVEAGVFAAGIFVYFALCSLLEMSRGARKLSPEPSMLRLGIFASVMAALAHNLIDSDMYCFGTGLGFFMLLGVGLQLSSDASVPEYFPKSLSRWVALIAVLPGLGLLFFGIAEQVMARLAFDLASKDIASAQAGAATLQGLIPFDGRTWNFSALVEPDDNKRLADFKRAAELMPLPRHFRSIARELESKRSFPEAETSLHEALLLDPNNLSALAFQMRVASEAGDTPRSIEIAKRIVAIEETPYYKVRSIPEIVPTETFEAREALADATTDEQEKIRYLKPAVNGYLEYAKTTVPNIVQIAGPEGNYGGLTMDRARSDLARAMQVAKKLQSAYRTSGATREAAEVDTALGVFAAAAGS